MAYLRQVLTERLVNDADAADPAAAVRPFDQNAVGGALGEGGGIVTLEAAETFEKRSPGSGDSGSGNLGSGGSGNEASGNGGARSAYAEVLGFGASQTVHRETKNRTPDPEGRGIVSAARAALREAQLEPDAIDVVIPFGLGHPDWDGPEAAALRTLLGDRLASVPVVTPKANVGNLGAGAGGYDLCLAAKILREQKLPPTLNRAAPLDGLGATTAKKIDIVLVFATGLGGQNTAIILRRLEA